MLDVQAIERAARDDLDDLQNELRVSATQYCECPGSGAAPCNASCDDGRTPRLYVDVEVEQAFTTLFPYPFIGSSLTLQSRALMRAQ